MQVGDYVRTKYGIGKIIETRIFLEREEIRLDSNTGKIRNVRDNTHWNDKEDIIKLSQNIIDLIEVGDYVNGKEVSSLQRYDDGTVADIRFYEEVEMQEYSFGEESDIKSIITKEQFSQMEYRIGE